MMRHRRSRFAGCLSGLILGWLITGTAGITAAQQLSEDETKFFETKIRPVLVKECYSCHSKQTGQIKGGLVVDTKEGLLRGGDSGAAIVPKDLSASLLWSAINYEDYQMPPRDKLSPQVIADFKAWIELGAPDPRTKAIAKDPGTVSKEDIRRGKQFWAFRPPHRAELPPPTAANWAVSPIDRWIEAKLQEQQLRPAADAEPLTVLRRLTFDLHGLPPTAEQAESFLAAWAANPQSAVESLTDALLQDPAFGERWGRHWLDLARYAESNGKETNQTFPEAWRYRDYVIDSMNQDKPYDQFVQEQLAGDLLPVKQDEDWAENLVATGFLALGPKSLNERNGRQFQLDLIDEQIDVSSRVFLGVSVACARCHDHKFDPIPQADYYALAGIFQNMTTHYGTLGSQQNRRSSNLLILPVSDPNPNLKQLTSAELAELKKAVVDAKAELTAAQQARREAARNGSPNNRSLFDLTAATVRLNVAEARFHSYDAQGNPRSFCMGVQSKEPVSNARLLVRGEFDQPTEEIPRGVPQVLSERPLKIKSNSSGRYELAKWVGSRDNPLTARVMANRIWQHLLGQGLVRTPENFGASGQPPTHPELLDYLALEFMENHWSVKQLIRQIVTSRIYRTSSAYDPDSFVRDPDNLYLWRVDPKRLEAEAIRDAMLAAGGILERDRPRGSPVATAGPATLRDGVLVAAEAPPNAMAAPPEMSSPTEMAERRDQRRPAGRLANRNPPRVVPLDQPVRYRSVYLPIVRDQFPRALDVLDFADASFVIAQRETSNTPDQGLYFLNNIGVLQASAALARRVSTAASTPAEQIDLAFRLALGRPATKDELTMSQTFLREFSSGSAPSRSANAELQRLAALCQSIFASAEFRYLD